MTPWPWPLTIDLQPKITTCRIVQRHLRCRIWIHWHHLSLSYATIRQTDRQTDANERFTSATVIAVSKSNQIGSNRSYCSKTTDAELVRGEMTPVCSPAIDFISPSHWAVARLSYIRAGLRASHTVTHPSTCRARRRATTLRLSQTATWWWYLYKMIKSIVRLRQLNHLLTYKHFQHRISSS